MGADDGRGVVNTSLKYPVFNATSVFSGRGTMMLVRFEAQGDRYRRIITFPDDSSVSESNISFPLKWHTPEPYLLIRPLHEYERADLVEEGKAIAATLLGSEGMRFLVEMGTSDPMQIVIQEDCQLPEVAR